MSNQPKSGLYGLIALGGAPIDPRDAAVLGLQDQTGSDRSGRWLAQGYDPCPQAVSRFEDPAGTTVLVGDVWDLPEQAAALGLPANAGAAQIARAAWHRHGLATAWHLRGEWTCFNRAVEGTVTIIASVARRDPVLFAVSAQRIAFAPDLFALARLDWVSRDLDEQALILGLAKGIIRQSRGASTMLAAVKELPAGGVLHILPHGEIQTSICPTPLDAVPHCTRYADAVAQIRQNLLDAMRQRIERYPATAILLSGGLDSSLLAWLVARCGADTSQIVCLTAAAPQGSGLADEAEQAALVARHLGLQLIRVVPPEHLDPYRPHDGILAGANGPPLSNRHVLTEAFQQAARGLGCQRMLNGTYGELSVTARLPPPDGSNLLKRSANQVRYWVGMVRRTPPETPFHVRLAPHRQPPMHLLVRPQHRPAGPLFGLMPGTAKAWSLPNEFYPGAVRMDYPFRDVGLLRLIGGMPRSLPAGTDGDRALVRSLLDGEVPDSIRLRRSGLPASPDHLQRLGRHAARARQRLPQFKAAGVENWLDLGWLDQALGGMARTGTQSHLWANQVQLTAMTAEFLLWWQRQAT